MRTLTRVAVVGTAALLAAGCSIKVGKGEDARPPSTSTTEVARTPGPSTGSRSILDGWVTYELLPAWEVVTEASGLEAIRADFDQPPPAFKISSMETLLELRRKDGLASASLLREPAFLDAADTDAWTAALADDLATEAVDLVDDRVIDLPHGQARRLVFQGLSGNLVLTTTEYGDQRIALVALADPKLDDGLKELSEVLSGIQLTPDVAITPLLQFHAGLTYFNIKGERVIEVGLHVPTNWQVEEIKDGSIYRSPDGSQVVEVDFRKPDGTPLEDALRAEVEGGADRGPLLQANERTIDGARFVVARHGPKELANVDLGTAWVLMTETDDIVVEMYLSDSGAHPDPALLRRIIDSILVRAP